MPVRRLKQQQQQQQQRPDVIGPTLGAEQDHFLVGPQESLQTMIKGQKLAWFGHVTRHNNLSKTILEGGRGQQRTCCKDNMTQWTSLPMPELLTMAFRRKGWQRISAESSAMSPLPPGLSLPCQNCVEHYYRWGRVMDERDCRIRISRERERDSSPNFSHRPEIPKSP